VLDIYGSNDWTMTMYGGPERLAQIRANPRSAQIIVPKATHFFEGQEEELLKAIAAFLDGAFAKK
jgi:alpha/beta superfamily hydrolase